jgi:NitT/TauT family transport system ATP-binding protein
MTASPLLEVRALGKQFAPRRDETSRWVLRDVSFTVARGELVTIVGPSGAGKTTLLNLIAQTEKATAGEICFDAEVTAAADRRPLRPGLSCRVGYVSQQDCLLPWRTALQNVLLPLEIQNRLTRQSQDRARELLHKVGLAGFEQHYPHELSGGMRQRVSLVRTLVYDPPVILMDEPFAGLDSQTRAALRSDLVRLYGGSKTIVFVTHDIHEAIVLGDRTLVLSTAPARVKSEYAIPFRRPRDLRALMLDAEFLALHDAICADIA